MNFPGQINFSYNTDGNTLSLKICFNRISKNTKERIFFNTQLKLTADSSWMRESIKKFGVIYFNEVICDFELNGISSVPSIRLIRLRLFEKNYHLVLSEMVKLFLFILLGSDNYFKITFYLKGMKKI